MEDRDTKQPLAELPPRDPLETPYPDRAARKPRGRHEAARSDRPRLWTGLIIASVVVLIGLMLYAVGRLSRRDAFERLQAADRAQTLADGVTVNSMPVGGLSRAQALQMLNARQLSDGRAFQYRIIAGERVWFMTQADLPLGSNADALIAQGWAASRALRLNRGEILDAPFAARARLRARLSDSGLSLTTLTGYTLDDVTRYAAGIAESVDREPVSAALAAVDFSRRSFSFSEDIPGLRLDQPALVGEITRLLDAGVTDADIEAPVQTTPARITRLRLMNTFGCLEIRSFETRTPGGDEGVQKLTAALNGVIIPGSETVSLRGLAEPTVTDFEQANASRFAAAFMDAGLCAGMSLIERSGREDAADDERGLDARLDAQADLRMKNGAETPMCVLCYYTPHNSRGLAGSVTLEVYGILREAGESAELRAETLEILPAGAPETRVSDALEPGARLLRREARDGARVNTLLVRKSNGRVFSTEVVDSWTYPAVNRLIETGPVQ